MFATSPNATDGAPTPEGAAIHLDSGGTAPNVYSTR
jgi:hypothetical protein